MLISPSGLPTLLLVGKIIGTKNQVKYINKYATFWMMS